MLTPYSGGYRFPVLRVTGSPIARGWPYSPWLAEWPQLTGWGFGVCISVMRLCQYASLLGVLTSFTSGNAIGNCQHFFPSSLHDSIGDQTIQRPVRCSIPWSPSPRSSRARSCFIPWSPSPRSSRARSTRPPRKPILTLTYPPLGRCTTGVQRPSGGAATQWWIR